MIEDHHAAIKEPDLTGFYPDKEAKRLASSPPPPLRLIPHLSPHADPSEQPASSETDESRVRVERSARKRPLCGGPT